MRVLIVHAHHEPKSFSSALYAQAAKTLSDQGHQVVTSDLYGQGFDPVSDRRNFVSVHDSEYLKQQVEEQYASQVSGFAPDLDAEIRKLESCDLLLFNFPMWWFGLPAILKGWVDRAFPMRRIYGDGKLYENGLGQAKKRAMVIMTVGGGRGGVRRFRSQPFSRKHSGTDSARNLLVQWVPAACSVRSVETGADRSGGKGGVSCAA